MFIQPSDRGIGGLLCAVIVAVFIALPAQAEIIELIANLDTDQESPAVDAATPNNAGGTATMSYDTDTNMLNWEIIFSGLSNEATAAHFHGPAAPGATAGVEVNIGDISGLDSPMIGSAELNDTQESDLLNGLWYINIHTALNGSGEIRGQVFRRDAVADQISVLDTDQEVPAVDSSTPDTAGGSANVIFDPDSNLLSWNITFSGLSGAAIGAHFHGPATSGVTASVQVNIGDFNGLVSPMAGSTTLDDTQESEILQGLWYINIHTDLNQPGEIRGQVLTEIFADQFENN